VWASEVTTLRWGEAALMVLARVDSAVAQSLAGGGAGASVLLQAWGDAGPSGESGAGT